jgi:hypothetical protein
MSTLQACIVRQSNVRWVVALSLTISTVYVFTVLDTYQHFASTKHMDSGFPFQRRSAVAVPAASTTRHATTNITVEAYVPPNLLDFGERCRLSGICDGDYSCGPDQLGCVTDPAIRSQYVVNATRWAWAGYRWVACRRAAAEALEAITHNARHTGSTHGGTTRSMH